MLLLAGCQEPPAGEARPPEIRLDGVAFRAYRGGDLALRGTAERGVYLRSTGEVEATRVAVWIPQPGGADLEVTAPSVRGEVAARSYRATGGLVATRGTDVARTPSAAWSAADGMIRGAEGIAIQGPSYRASGPAFELDPATGDLALTGGVAVVAHGPERAGR